MEKSKPCRPDKEAPNLLGQAYGNLRIHTTRYAIIRGIGERKRIE